MCLREQNNRVVVIIISRKERRERGVLIFLPFTLALEMSQVSLRQEYAEAGRQTNIVNNYWFPAASALSCRAEPAISPAIALYSKIFASSACGNKTSVWWLYIPRKERRERGVLIFLPFTLALEMSQVSLRQEYAEAGRQTNIVNNYWFPAASALSCRAEPAISPAIALYSKIFASSACGNKTSVWWLLLSHAKSAENAEV